MKSWVVRWIVADDPTIPPYETEVDAPDSAAAHAISLEHLKASREDWRRWSFRSAILVPRVDDSWSVPS